MPFKQLAMLCLLCLSLVSQSGCATRLPEHDAPPSHAIEVPAHGILARYMRQQPADGLDQSGFILLYHGIDALSARLQLIDTAQTSLDLQYYIYKGDITGGLIADRLIAAADRGVRVRLLVDDVGNSLSDRALATLDRHGNIEVRLFNPVSVRHKWLKLPTKAAEFGRINNRMHNKLLVADNLALITGGRNIGDEYFTLSELDFQDIDVLGIGSISRDASRNFDDFWNSPAAIPANVIYSNAKQGTLNRMRKGLASHREELSREPYLQAMKNSPFSQQLSEGTLRLYWGRAEWMADPPEKAVPRAEEKEVPFLGRMLARHARETERELLLMSAYFIPGDDGSRLLLDIVEKGADVSILTNSLATTDVLAVHSSYVNYRRPLLEGGVRLWELQPMAAKQEVASPFLGESLASLHAKSFVFDRERLFIGSINLDPRSISLNTESGVMVYQADLAERLVNLFQRWTADDFAFELQLSESGSLTWHGRGQTWTSEPEVTLSRRFMTWMLGWLPIEDQL